MAARNPARVIGMDHEIGTIEIGKKANLVMVDHRFNVKMTILEGKVWNKKE
jgi:N-acetylglucosamine-6-phosphate deacetylase